MEDFNWKLIFEGISTLARALPKDERLRRWVVVGAVVLVALAAVASSQASGDKK